MLDRYLSVMFGRPRLLHDEDIDQDLPDEINDEDMLQEDPERRTGSADCMMIASILHFKCVQSSCLFADTDSTGLVAFWATSLDSSTQ